MSDNKEQVPRRKFLKGAAVGSAGEIGRAHV